MTSLCDVTLSLVWDKKSNLDLDSAFILVSCTICRVCTYVVKAPYQGYSIMPTVYFVKVLDAYHKYQRPFMESQWKQNSLPVVQSHLWHDNWIFLISVVKNSQVFSKAFFVHMLTDFWGTHQMDNVFLINSDGATKNWNQEFKIQVTGCYRLII